MPLSAIDLCIPRAKVVATHTAPGQLLWKTTVVAGVHINLSVSFNAQKQLYVYYFVVLDDVVTEVNVRAQASIVNQNGNKCRAARFNRVYANGERGGWGQPLATFPLYGSIEKYIVGDTLTIRVEIEDLIRMPDDRVLLQRIYRSTNAKEQALFEARLEEQTKFNKKQEETIATLRETIEGIRSQLRDAKKRKAEDMATTGSSSPSSPSSSSSSSSGGGGAAGKGDSAPAHLLNRTMLLILTFQPLQGKKGSRVPDSNR